MENQKEKIKRFSKLVNVFIVIATVALIVVAVFEAAAWVWSGAGLPVETVFFNGTRMELPLLFKLGNSRIFLPVMWKVGFDFAGAQGVINGIVPSVGYGDFIGAALTIVALRYTGRVFKLLMENGSPFREDVVKALRKLSVVLLITGGVAGVINFLSAGVAWVLCLVFDYGRSLQKESDETL